MNGGEAVLPSRNVTIEDETEPGDLSPRSPSPLRELSPSPARQSSLHKLSPSSPQVVDLDTPAPDEPEFVSQLAYHNALIRQATMPVLPPDLEDFGIPPSPPGSPDPILAQKLENFRQLQDQGVYFNDRLSGNRGFRNPKLLERLRGYAGVEDEYGSHLPESIWNPHGFSEDQYYDKLGMSLILTYSDFVAEKQRQEFEALQARQQNESRSSIEFTSSSSNPAAAISQKSAAERIMEGLNSRPNSRPVSRTGSDADRKRQRHDERRDDRRDDRGYHRGGERRDDRRNGGGSKDRSRERERHRDRSRERDRGRGGYRDRDDRGRSNDYR